MTLQRLFTGLARQGHDITVIRPRQKGDSASQQPLNEEVFEGGGRLREYTVMGLPLMFYDGLQFGPPSPGFCKRIWAEQQTDVVHVATEGPLGIGAVLKARNLGIPVVSSFHTNFHTYGKHYGYGFLIGFSYWYMRKFHNRTRHTFVPSQDLVKQLENDGYQGVEILGRGVDTELFDPAHRSEELRAEWGAQPEDPVVIYVGRVADEKNIPLTAKAYSRLKESIPNAKFVVVGDGPVRERIQKEYPETHFAGIRRGEDLARHYASADIFLFASVTETFGNVVTEAMASGLLVLAYDYAAPQRYIEEGNNGYLAAFDNENEYLKKTEELAKSKDQWPELRKNARQTAMGISWTSIVDKYERTLKNLIQP